jgi:hypothetical protein
MGRFERGLAKVYVAQRSVPVAYLDETGRRITDQPEPLTLDELAAMADDVAAAAKVDRPPYRNHALRASRRIYG